MEYPFDLTEPDAQVVHDNVRAALAEDVGSGDISAALIPAQRRAEARVITRENGVLCGRPWAAAVFAAVDPAIEVTWHKTDGDTVTAGATVCTAQGPARSLLSAERCALNFLQLLSGTATLCRSYADLVRGTTAKLLDTRKTIPGLRIAQKYAVRCGGCHNHRIGLFDAFLIKENHISACGSISAAVATARRLPGNKPVEVEVENLEQLREAIAASAEIIMLDNFSLPLLREAVALNAGQAKLEASGGINQDTLVPIAETGVDYISIGALTKDCRAVDLSMLFTTP